MILSFLKRLRVNFHRKTAIHYMGDSHTEVFKFIKQPAGMSPKFCIVQGATASGLKNPHSQSQSGPIIDRYLSENVSSKDWAVFHLGEVDCGFLLWVKAERENQDILNLLLRALDNYYDIILKAKEIVGHKIIVTSVILPTIKDNCTIGNVANLRGSIKAKQSERTTLTIKMSSMLRSFCEKHGLLYFDLYPYILDKRTGLINEYYLNENPEDHHLSNKKLAHVVSNLFNNLKL